jgi:tetratricopeptide (TPR) repeat protein
MKTALVLVSLAAVATPALAQDPAAVRRLFEAGRYEQVVDAVGETANPALLMAAAGSHQKLGSTQQANDIYKRLAERPDDDPWHFIGASASQLVDGEPDAAIASAERGVEIGATLADAHYQLGLVLAFRQRWKDAAVAFDRAAGLEPSRAYPYYYAGLMHYRAKSPDLMAVRFERFLKLALEAPERPEVLQIMRTIRGR